MLTYKYIIYLCLLLFFLNLNNSYCQSIQFILVDTIQTNLKSELDYYDLLFNTNDSLIYYINKTEPNKNGGKYLSFNIIHFNSRARTLIKLADAGDDVDIMEANYLLMTESSIIIAVRSYIIFYDRKGNFIKKIEKTYGFQNLVYLKSHNKLILIDYHFFHILSRKSLLKLQTFDIAKMAFENKKEIPFAGIQYTIHNSKYRANDDKYFYIAEPLNNKVKKYNFELSVVDSFLIDPFNEYSVQLEQKLSLENEEVIRQYDSLIALKKDYNFIKNFFWNNNNLQAKYMYHRLESIDSLVDRIQKINIFGDKLFVIKKMKGYDREESDIDIFDIHTKEHLMKNVYYKSDRDTIKTKDDFFYYCLQCTSTMNYIVKDKKVYTYQLNRNNYFPDTFTSKEVYNINFDKWILNNEPHYMLLIYEIILSD